MKAMRRSWWLVGVTAALGLALSWWYTGRQAPLYYTSSQVLFAVTAKDSDDPRAELLQGMAFSKARIATYAELAYSTAVVDEALRTAGLTDEIADVQQRLVTAPIGATGTITLTLQSPNAERGARLADALAEALIARVTTLEASLSGGRSPVTGLLVRRATVPTVPAWPRPSFNLALGLVGGLVVGVGLAVGREQLDLRVRGAARLRESSGVNPLAVVPLLRGGRRSREGTAARLEALRQLRTSLAYASVDRALKALVVTSPDRYVGKTVLARDVAQLFAASGSQVLLVDADLRGRGLTRVLTLEDLPGLTDVLAGLATLPDVVLHREHVGCYVVPGGPPAPNPAELVGSRRMSEVIAWSRAKFDLVVIDAASLQASETAALAAAADAALLVVGDGRSRSDAVAAARQALAGVNARLAGIVLNGVPRRPQTARVLPAADVDAPLPVSLPSTASPGRRWS